MKKIIALCLAALMTMLCAVSFAENTVSTQIETGTDKFDVSFQLPEGARVLEGADWQEGNLYMANIMLKEGEYLYLSVDASGTENEAGLVTYNEASGYTDDAVLALTDVFADESVIVDRQVLTTAYGTKIAVEVVVSARLIGIRFRPSGRLLIKPCSCIICPWVMAAM